MPPIRERHETISQAILLAGVGGFLDAFTFVRFRVFANAQSGNVVLLAVDAAAGQWREALQRLAPIAAFIAGVLLVETLARPTARRVLRRPLRVVLAVEVLGLLIVSVLPSTTPQSVITITVSFVAAIQFSTFRMVAGQVYTTLLTSGNLRSAVVHFHHWLVDGEIEARAHAFRFTEVIGAFALGAAVGALITPRINNVAVVVPAVLLLIVLVMLIMETRRLGRRTVPAPPGEQTPPSTPTAG